MSDINQVDLTHLDNKARSKLASMITLLLSDFKGAYEIVCRPTGKSGAAGQDFAETEPEHRITITVPAVGENAMDNRVFDKAFGPGKLRELAEIAGSGTFKDDNGPWWDKFPKPSP